MRENGKISSVNNGNQNDIKKGHIEIEIYMGTMNKEAENGLGKWLN